MILRTTDLRQREVINVITAERIGYVSDVEMNCESGCIEALIVPIRRGLGGLFGRRKDCIVPWDKIVSIGRDLVLVKLDTVEVVR